ncbi:MAG TPA: murein biosynthesis integral membrane protein MurJ [candidate division Zixibacteria bacterium]|nr:murein biosynthesis integral membrane protein MurJ [candidate division Zixibacteria bacterium]
MAQPEVDPVRNDRLRIIQAAGIIGAAFVVSRLLGVLRDAAINFYFDIDSLEANAYFIANGFPEFIFYIVAGGALGSAFIPTFSAYFVRDDAPGGWRLFSAIVNLITIAATVIAVVSAIFAPQLIRLFYPDLVSGDPELLETAVTLMRILLLTTIIFGVSGVVMAALNARQHFLLPAIAPIIYNLGIIAGILLLAPNVIGLAIGAVAGALGHLAIQLPGLRRQKAKYSFLFTLRDPGVLQVLRLMFPRVLGLSFGQLNHLLMRFLAQSMVIGSIPAIGFAWRITIMPLAIVGQALAIAAFPTFATLAAEGAIGKMRRILADTLRLIFFLSLPAAILLILLRRPIVAVLFQRGEFGSDSTEFVAWALLFFAMSLVGLTAIEIIARVFYALEDTWTPVLAGALQLIAMWAIGLWLSRNVFPAFDWLELGALALGYSISTFLELGLLLWLLRRKMGGIDGKRLFNGLWRMLLATTVMFAITWITRNQLNELGVFWQMVVGGLVGAASYIIASLLFGVKETRQLAEYGRERLINRKRSKE